MLQADDLKKKRKGRENNIQQYANLHHCTGVHFIQFSLMRMSKKTFHTEKRWIYFSTYILYRYGVLLFDKAFMCEYKKLATCKLVSLSIILAMVVIRGRAGLASKMVTQAIIRTSGESERSIKSRMRMSSPWREKIGFHV